MPVQICFGGNNQMKKIALKLLIGAFSSLLAFHSCRHLIKGGGYEHDAFVVGAVCVLYSTGFKLRLLGSNASMILPIVVILSFIAWLIAVLLNLSELRKFSFFLCCAGVALDVVADLCFQFAARYKRKRGHFSNMNREPGPSS